MHLLPAKCFCNSLLLSIHHPVTILDAALQKHGIQLFNRSNLRHRHQPVAPTVPNAAFHSALLVRTFDAGSAKIGLEGANMRFHEGLHVGRHHRHHELLARVIESHLKNLHLRPDAGQVNV
jgi:hypothetical protein